MRWEENQESLEDGRLLGDNGDSRERGDVTLAVTVTQQNALFPHAVVC